MAFNINPTRSDGYVRNLTPFNGVLMPNEVFGSIYNMILDQIVRYPQIADNYGFVEMFKTQGSMYGDTVLFYDQDVLSSRPWLGDAEAQNLLSVERPDDPECQAVVLKEFRVIKTSLDSYLTKRAWSTENAFTQFNSIVQSMIRKTKELYEVSLVNVALGTVEADEAKAASTVEVPVSDITATGEEKNRLEAQMIAQYLADTIVDMKDYSRKYNDYGFMRAYTDDELMVVWNSSFVNRINKLDIPTIFNKDGLMDKFAQHVLPSRYFGTDVDGDSLPSGLAISSEGGITYITIDSDYNGATIRTKEEGMFDSTALGKKVHLFPGEDLPKGAKFELGKAYFADEDIICKIITKDTIKYLASFETATEFWNPQALITSNLLIWGFSEPTKLKGQPCVVLHKD